MGLPFAEDEPFDPKSLSDPVALTTGWRSCSGGGANFSSRVLVAPGTDRVAFRPTVLALLLYALLLVVGFAFPCAAAYKAVAQSNRDAGVFVMLGLILLAFGGAGGAVTWFGTRPIVFDRAIGKFSKGWSAPQTAELTSIHAVQVILGFVGKSGNEVYELNLVLKEGARIGVVAHVNLARLRKDAEALAKFLGVPCWDAA